MQNNYSEQFLLFVDPLIVNMSRYRRIKGKDQDEIAQDLRLHLWSKLGSFDPKKGKIKSWAFVVCRHKITDLARGKHDLLDIGYSRKMPYDDEEQNLS